MTGCQILCLALFCFCLYSVIAKSPKTVNCELDDDGLNPELSACLSVGRTLMKRYLRRLMRWKHVDRCEESKEFRACISPFVAKCATIRERLARHWRPVMEMLECACKQNAECQRSLDCFETEYGGVMVHRCEEFYLFNIDQKTRSTCHFLRKNIHCKEALVTSACGAEAGVFAFHAAKLAVMPRIRKLHCYVSQHRHGFSEFRYEDACPSNFTDEMNVCNTLYLSSTALTFLQDNNLVAKGGKTKVRDACRDYRQYLQCMKPINHACNDGTRLVYDYDGRLRTYLLKMEYICHEAREDYTSYLPCYQEVVQNETLLSCKGLWETLQPLLDNITSYQFYCEPTSEFSRSVAAELRALRICYQEVFEESCGPISAKTMGRLIAKAFADPRYLRFGYVAECAAHAPTSYPAQRMPSPAPPEGVSRRHYDGVTDTRRIANRRTIVGRSTSRACDTVAAPLTALTITTIVMFWRQIDR